jgi:hypothetical protein
MISSVVHKKEGDQNINHCGTITPGCTEEIHVTRYSVNSGLSSAGVHGLI